MKVEGRQPKKGKSEYALRKSGFRLEKCESRRGEN